MENLNFCCVRRTINYTEAVCIYYIDICWCVNIIMTHLLLLSKRQFLSIGMEIIDSLSELPDAELEMCEGYCKSWMMG